MTEKQQIITMGLVGLLAAVLVGAGEFLLHYDPLARYGQGFDFFKGVTEGQATIGHFLGVLGAPLYVIGSWHIYLMLRPANRFWAGVAFLAMAYGCIVGAVWIGSRATAASIVNTAADASLPVDLSLYELRYETLLTIVRAAVLVLSAIFIWLTLTGRTHYPRWMAVFNPILLILATFLIFWLAPGIGKYLMPIALNVSYFILFSLSTVIAAIRSTENHVNEDHKICAYRHGSADRSYGDRDDSPRRI
jgi:hypothetical protein